MSSSDRSQKRKRGPNAEPTGLRSHEDITKERLEEESVREENAREGNFRPDSLSPLSALYEDPRSTSRPSDPHLGSSSSQNRPAEKVPVDPSHSIDTPAHGSTSQDPAAHGSSAQGSTFPGSAPHVITVRGPAPPYADNLTEKDSADFFSQT